MEAGQLAPAAGRLALMALTSFFAILLWSRTRDSAWILMILGAISAYAEAVYSILRLAGIGARHAGPLFSLAFACLPAAFFAASFAVMTARKYRRF